MSRESVHSSLAGYEIKRVSGEAKIFSVKTSGGDSAQPRDAWLQTVLVYSRAPRLTFRYGTEAFLYSAAENIDEFPIAPSHVTDISEANRNLGKFNIPFRH